jgi:hypothetical protein
VYHYDGQEINRSTAQCSFLFLLPEGKEEKEEEERDATTSTSNRH